MKRQWLALTLLAFGCAGVTSVQAQSGGGFTPRPASPPPDVPDGGYHGGGDNVPYIPHRNFFIGMPVITGAALVNGHLHFKFQGSGPVMRYNIVWSRPGNQQTDMRWVKDPDHLPPEEYIVNEPAAWDADYVFKVQAESVPAYKDNNGVPHPHQLTSFATVTFHTPRNPAYKDVGKATDDRSSAIAPRRRGKDSADVGATPYPRP